MSTEKVLEKRRISVKTQVLASAAAIVGAAVIPQLFHALGAVSGLGMSLGEIFLPMHLPIIIVGLLAGPYAGAASGLIGPLASFAVSGMPGISMLPFMMIELCIYGLVSGLLRGSKMPVIAKVLAAQLAGRAVRAAAVLIAVYGFGSGIASASIWTSVSKGLFGLVLQWTFIPLIIYRIENAEKNERISE